jgi:alcohol dehydrogenase class IV
MEATVKFIRVNMKEFDFSEADIEHTAKWAINDLSREANPRDITPEQIKEIMRSCI